jgi:hypothetical protein
LPGPAVQHQVLLLQLRRGQAGRLQERKGSPNKNQRRPTYSEDAYIVEGDRAYQEVGTLLQKVISDIIEEMYPIFNMKTS